MAPLSAAFLLVALLASFEAVRRGVLAAGMLAGPGAEAGLRHAADSFRERLSGFVEGTRLGALRERAREERRQRAMREAMPEMLRLLCIALDSGSSLVQALSYAADNCDEPLASELERTVWDMESGQGFEEALEKLRERAGGAEFSYLAVAMEIQHRTGSSLAQVLASVSQSLQGVTELEESLQTQTAQGRLSARIVVAMPFAVLAIVSVVSPGYVSAFFGSAAGVGLLALAVLLECAGVVLVKKALSVDVSAGSLGARS